MARARYLVLLLLLFFRACDVAQGPTPEVSPTIAEGQTATTVVTATPTAQVPTFSPTAASALEETASPSSPAPSATSVPAVSNSWFPFGAVLVVALGDDDSADVNAVGADATLQTVFTDAGDEVSISPKGRWLGYVRLQDTGSSTLVVHNATSGERREINPDTRSGMLRFLFDPEGSRLAYVDLGAYVGGRVPWSLVVSNLDTQQSVRYDAVMVDTETRPLPGVPVAWSQSGSRDHIILDTFLPYTESGWMGVWAIPLPAGSISGLLDTLSPIEMVPSGGYSSDVILAPDGEKLAYLARDPNYVPDNYVAEYYDLAVNQLAIAGLEDRTREILVEVDDGGALARAIAWSPASERLLFVQGTYEGEQLTELTLKSTDLDGTVVTYGPLNLPRPSELVKMAWCSSGAVFLVTLDWHDGLEKLSRVDLNTGAVKEISARRRVDIVTCVP
jgi:hypothetical protein